MSGGGTYGTGKTRRRDEVGVVAWLRSKGGDRAGRVATADRPLLPDPQGAVRDRARRRQAELMAASKPSPLGDGEGDLLLGQSFLSKLPAWTIDYKRSALLISTSQQAAPARRLQGAPGGPWPPVARGLFQQAASTSGAGCPPVGKRFIGSAWPPILVEADVGKSRRDYTGNTRHRIVSRIAAL